MRDGDGLLTTEDAAAYLGIKVGRLYDQYRAWGLDPYRVGRTLRWRQSDIDAWLEKQRVGA